ncbi:hypothetical protein KL949_004642 [Ogataea haglerorum]|nr:hypothetical protein KL949_004642 [Ogataea haglerorum]KAG7714916.1 hypothetical protein KL913_004237 [Ogataea haglerorum]KAG7754411.1 hypothetical protein KL947_004811 [Ogataea haglerorum]KAG7764294.1 hypothetical protein KL931_004816 [Ogataea haglerorum]
MSAKQRPRQEETTSGQINSSTTLEKGGSGRLGKFLSQESVDKSTLTQANGDFEEEDDGFIFKRASQQQVKKKVPGKRGRPPGSKNKPKPAVNKEPRKRQKVTQKAPEPKPPKTSLLDELEQDSIVESEEEEEDKIFSMNSSFQPPKAAKKSNIIPKSKTSEKRTRKPRNTKTPAKEHDVETQLEIATVHDLIPEDPKPALPKQSTLSKILSQARTKEVKPEYEVKKRRSSLSNRGKRLSSVGNGFVAEPDREIPVEELYRHVSQDLPDPHKMRQLMVWCAKRGASKGPKKKISTAESIANVIEDEVIRDLADGKINTSWWLAEDDDNEVDHGSTANLNKPIIVLPNKANEENMHTLELYEKKLAELNKEEAQWMEVRKIAKLPKIQVDAHLQSDSLIQEKLGEIVDQLASLESYKARLDKLRLLRILENIKLMVHKLKQSKNAVNTLTEATIREISRKMTQLIDHDNDGNKVSPLDLLKGFSELG